MRIKRGIILFLLVIANLTIVGCDEKAFNLKSEPKFNLILVDQPIREYIEKAEEKKEDLDRLYRETVFEPIFGQFDYSNTPLYAQRTSVEFNVLEDRLDTLVKEDVIGIVEGTLKKCTEYITGVDVTVYIFPFYPEETKELFTARGVEGYAYLDNADIEYVYRVKFGDGQEFPFATSYRIGYNIMEEFIKNNPDISIDEWMDMDVKEIFEMSGYKKKFKNTDCW